MGPQNAIAGEGNYGTDLPQTTPTVPDLMAERNMVKFSKTNEFKRLKEVLEQRMDYYRAFAPGSPYASPIAYRDLPNDERGWRTLVADVLIEEFQGLINAYEQASDIVNDANTKKK